jgi:hypothetical protein
MRVALLLVGLALAALLRPAWPSERTIHYVLGSGAARVEQLNIRWTEGPDPERGTDLHASSFRFALGRAPMAVEHRLRLRDGTYSVELEILSGAARQVVRRTVTLRAPGFGAESLLSIDLAGDVAAAHDVKLDSATEERAHEPR